MANSTVNSLNDMFSKGWLKENIIWSERRENFDLHRILTGEIKLRRALRYPRETNSYVEEGKLKGLAKERIIDDYYHNFQNIQPDPVLYGRPLNTLRSNEMGELAILAAAFQNKLQELNITDHVEIHGIEANRRGRCFLSDSRPEIALPTEYEDDV